MLFLAHSYPRWTGDLPGAFLHRLATALADQDVTVDVVAPAGEGAPADEVLDGVRVRRYRYATRGAERLAYTGTMVEQVRASWGGRAALVGLLAAGAAAARAAARRASADVVHAHWWFPGALSARVPGVLGGRPLVITLHGSDVRLAQGVRPARRLFRHVAGRSARVTAVSRWLCQQAEAMAPGLACEVGPMPVAAHLFAPPPPDAPRAGVLFVGRLTQQKGVHDLLRAAALAPPVPVTVVGSGPEEGALHALAAELGLAERVTWLPSQPQERLAALYRAAQVVAVPSHEEGLGLVAVEAGLCGAPVVGYDSGGLPDVVEDGANGRLVPPGDVAAFARALAPLLADRAAAARLGARGRERAARFTPDAVAAQYRGVYDRVLAAPARRAVRRRPEPHP